MYSGTESLQLIPTASSIYNPSYAAERCKLNYSPREGAHSWCAAYNNNSQFLQFSSPVAHVFHEVLTQGRGDTDQWVTSFKLKFSIDGIYWNDYQNGRTFKGNYDRNTIVHHKFEPFYAYAVRIIPVEWYEHISLRADMIISDSSYGAGETRKIVAAISSGCPVQVSSIYDPSYDSSRIRIGFEQCREGSNSWCAGHLDNNQWVQVSSIVSKKWLKVDTQGRENMDQWVTKYFITYTNERNIWHAYGNMRIFEGNTDRNTVVSHSLEPFVATSVRIHPVSWYSHISMRLEFYFQDLD